MNIKFSKEEMAIFNAAFYHAKNVEKLPPLEARTKAMGKVLENRAYISAEAEVNNLEGIYA